MSEEILINVTPNETRVAQLENGVLQEVSLERAGRRGWVGNIYKGRVSRVLTGMQAAFVEIGLTRTAFLHASDMQRRPDDDADAECAPEADITTLLAEGDEVVVQVIKDPLGSKGARLTTTIALASRCLVLLPDSGQIGISARIEAEQERQRLRTILETLRDGEQPGYIVRTNAENMDADSLAADVAFLQRLWNGIQRRVAQTAAGEMIYEDLPLVLRTLRDMLGREVEKVRIDSRYWYEKSVDFVTQLMPDRAPLIHHYPGERPIFDLYGVDDEIDQALRRTSPLKSGGYLVIDQTESMTTIDVNTGGYVGHRKLEDTIYKTNLEAAQAIARQLRLRNLGGIIIIDFIDMADAQHQSQVMNLLERSLSKDHAKTQIHPLSPLGLVEMTRKRTTESLAHILCEPCPSCDGRGAIKTAESMSHEVFREVMRAVKQFAAEKLMVIAAVDVVDYILEEEQTAVMELEQSISKPIQFKAEDQYSQEQFDVVVL